MIQTKLKSSLDEHKLQRKKVNTFIKLLNILTLFTKVLPWLPVMPDIFDTVLGVS